MNKKLKGDEGPAILPFAPVYLPLEPLLLPSEPLRAFVGKQISGIFLSPALCDFFPVDFFGIRVWKLAKRGRNTGHKLQMREDLNAFLADKTAH